MGRFADVEGGKIGVGNVLGLVKGKQKLAVFVALVTGANLMIHAQIGRGGPGVRAGLEERLAWIDRSANLHIGFAITSLLVMLAASVIYHCSRQRASSEVTS